MSMSVPFGGVCRPSLPDASLSSAMLCCDYRQRIALHRENPWTPAARGMTPETHRDGRLTQPSIVWQYLNGAFLKYPIKGLCAFHWRSFVMRIASTIDDSLATAISQKRSQRRADARPFGARAPVCPRCGPNMRTSTSFHINLLKGTPSAAARVRVPARADCRRTQFLADSPSRETSTRVSAAVSSRCG
jgi:hypothetical protein